MLARITIVLLLLGAPVAGWAQCACGIGDGQFTLTTIGVDGDMSDWAAVHADVDNNVCDGPAGGLVDRDAPVQSTGRDLVHFAYTWDSTNVYLFTQRTGSANNVQSFAYYADIDNDGLMETGEPVIGVTWQGSNRQISVYVFTYQSAAPGGDPMADAGGFGDGYTLPGSFVNVPSQPVRSGPWGSGNGQQMEFFITWAELGLPANSPFTFHVASSNASLGAASFTSQIDDNLSGCGGLLGSTVITSLTFVPDLAITALAGQVAVAAHTLTNTGNAADSFDLSSATSGTFTPTLQYYEDTDGSGTLTPGDLLLTDTDGDGIPNTSVLAAGGAVTILIAYDVSGGTGGDTATVITTAASAYRPSVTASVTDTLEIAVAPSLIVTKSAAVISDPVNLGSNPKAIPGSTVEYTVTVTNQGPGEVDAGTFEVVDAIPSNACLLLDDLSGPASGPVAFTDGSPASGLSYAFAGLGDGGDDLEFSDDGGSTYTYTPTVGPLGCDPNVSHVRINPTGIFAAEAGAGSPTATFSFRILIN